MKVLTITAHPDDETMLCGGTLALLNRQGADQHFLCATRGEGGEMGEPPLCTREQLGEVRASEMACAVQALGGGDLEFMGYLDPVADGDDTLQPFTSDLLKFQSEIRQAIRRIHPDVILTHGSSGEYGHPGHRLVHAGVCRAVASLEDEKPVLYTFQAAFEGHPRPRVMNRGDPADLVLDLAPVLEAKIQATLCHRTQHASFVRRASLQAGRPLSVPEIVVARESLHRLLPQSSTPRDILARALLATGCASEREN